MPVQYEVLVEGELGTPLLRYLNGPHRVVPAAMVTRVRATEQELEDILRHCVDGGATVERVTRIDSPSLDN